MHFCTTPASRAPTNMPTKVDRLSKLPLLGPSDFKGRGPERRGKVLVFFYAAWCPFSRAACLETDCIRDQRSYDSYAVDLSDEENPLWDDLGISIVPTLIGYREGEEILRKEGARMVGLKRADFKAADGFMKEQA